LLARFQEADAVAERYAQAFVNTNQLSIDEVNRLLNDHAHTVQRLRIRQDAEKQRMNDILAVKRQQRRREKAANGDADHSDEDKESSEAEEAELNKVSDELASYGALQSRIDVSTMFFVAHAIR
jgi:hypothetical protein